MKIILLIIRARMYMHNSNSVSTKWTAISDIVLILNHHNFYVHGGYIEIVVYQIPTNGAV